MADFSATPSPAAIVDANKLMKDGKRPFHLKLSFQLYELDGKPSEKGTVDHWWAGPEGSHLEITTPSLGTVHTFKQDASLSPAARRSLFLIDELLEDVQNPGSFLNLNQNQVQSEERVFGTTILECMHTVQKPSPMPIPPTQVCADSTSGNIRLVESQAHQIARNHPGVFSGTQVDIDTSVTWGGLQAITGHIEQLQSFDPAKAPLTLNKPAAAEPSKAPTAGSVGLASGGTRRAGGVIAGTKVSGNSPVYPTLARVKRIQGTVMLQAVISKQGKVDSLFPLASPDPLLTDAAIQAVKSWTYIPYLLNGAPTEVSTTITVNFYLNPSAF